MGPLRVRDQGAVNARGIAGVKALNFENSRLRAAIFIYGGSMSEVQPSKNVQTSFEFLREIVSDKATDANFPVAASIKSSMLDEQPDFDERTLGFRKFLEFLKAAESAGFVKTLIDPNGHPRVYPTSVSQESIDAFLEGLRLASERSTRMRGEVWRAFVEWRPVDYWRGWDYDYSRIFMAPVLEDSRAPWEVNPERFIEIPVVSMDQQMTWMREFSQNQSNVLKSNLLEAIGPQSTPGSFKRKLNEYGLSEQWASALRSRVTEQVSEWARSARVPMGKVFEQNRQERTQVEQRTEKLSSGGEAHSTPDQNVLGNTGEPLRLRLHEVLDSMQTHELAVLNVPARFLIKE